MRMTRKGAKLHEKCMELVALERDLTDEEKLFIFDNFNEGAEINSREYGAFFTPIGLARDFAINLSLDEGPVKILDLCAGIGMLSYVCAEKGATDITCVEISEEYARVGSKIVPQAKWITADALDSEILKGEHFDIVISNPPFGKIKSPFLKNYKSSAFEYAVIERASLLGDYGVFIVPQTSAPFIYSGEQQHRWINESNHQARLFEKKTGIKLGFNCGIDTSRYSSEWHGTNIVCEILCCDL